MVFRRLRELILSSIFKQDRKATFNIATACFCFVYFFKHAYLIFTLPLPYLYFLSISLARFYLFILTIAYLYAQLYLIYMRRSEQFFFSPRHLFGYLKTYSFALARLKTASNVKLSVFVDDSGLHPGCYGSISVRSPIFGFSIL